MLDGLSGQDPNRQVVILHNDHRCYLFFFEVDKIKPEVYAEKKDYIHNLYISWCGHHWRFGI